MSDISKIFSRRSMLTGIVVLPELATSIGAQLSSEAKAAAEQTRTTLKNAKGAKLVLLGTGAGPLRGRSRHITPHVIL